MEDAVPRIGGRSTARGCASPARQFRDGCRETDRNAPARRDSRDRGPRPTAVDVAVAVAVPIAVTVHVAVPIIFSLLEPPFLAHEILRVLPDSFANLRMVVQEGFQFRVVLQVIAIIDQRRILAQLVGDIAVAVQELIEARQLFAVNVSASLVFAPVEALFRVHERVRMQLDLFAHSGMILQKALQLGMLLQVILIVD